MPWFGLAHDMLSRRRITVILHVDSTNVDLGVPRTKETPCPPTGTQGVLQATPEKLDALVKTPQPCARSVVSISHKTSDSVQSFHLTKFSIRRFFLLCRNTRQSRIISTSLVNCFRIVSGFRFDVVQAVHVLMIWF